MNRRLPGAMITDPTVAAARIVRLVTEGSVETIEGQVLELRADTICTHSDTPGALEIVQAVRAGLIAAGVSIQAPGQ